jgi:hypothetical protein
MSLFKAAKEYVSLGISVIATDANKRAVMMWKPFQERLPDEQELYSMTGHSKAQGLAIICGEVSKYCEAIDIDCKYDLSGSLFEDFMQCIMDADPNLAKALVIAKTKSGGYHLIYRCPAIEGNLKLALRPTTDEEKKGNAHDKVRVLIETRGEAGYIIAAPSAGYSFIQNSPRNIPVITPDQRRMLFEIARSFHQVIEEEPTYSHEEGTKAFHKSPFADYNERGDTVALLQKHGWQIVKEKGGKVMMLRPGETTSKSSGDYSKDLNLFTVFTTSTIFEPLKGYRPSAVYTMLEHNGNWKEAGRALLNAGYGEPYKKVSKDVRRFVHEQKEIGKEGSTLVAELSERFHISEDQAKKTIQTIEEETNDETFWVYDADKEKISILYTRFARFLELHGFGLYFYDKSTNIFKIVHNDNGRLSEVTPERIKKFTTQFVMDYPLDGVEYTKEQLLETIYRNDKLFSDSLFEHLKAIDIDFLKDTPATAFIPFRNGIVEIHPKGIRLASYGEVQKVIWKNDLIDAHIDIDQGNDNGCEYLDFLTKITGNDKERLLSAISLIGYLLHKYKHPARPYAVILAEETEDDTKGGGTGKGIFIKALERMLPTESIDGKAFKPDKSFAWQRVSLATKIIALQDVNKFFPFESLNSILTEGLTLEKKNKDELYIRYEDAPKFVISTNYTIADEAAHSKRRQKVIEFSGYFGPQRTPFDEYGHMMFSDWDSDEYNRFYNFMFFCIQYYLKHGVKDMPQGQTYKAKKIKVQFGDEWYSYFEDYSGNGCANWERFNDMYSGFLKKFDLDKKEFSSKKFKKALVVTADNFGYNLEQQKMRQDNNLLHIKMNKGVTDVTQISNQQ